MDGRARLEHGIRSLFRDVEDVRQEEIAALASRIGDCFVRRGPTPRRQRKPSVGKMVAAAEKAGKTVTSVVATPDGVTLHFGASEPTAAVNEWLADLDKVTKQ